MPWLWLDLITAAQNGMLSRRLAASAGAGLRRRECLPFDLIHSIQGQGPRLSVECVHSVQPRVKPSVAEAALILSLAGEAKTVIVWHGLWTTWTQFSLVTCAQMKCLNPSGYFKCFLQLMIMIRALAERKVRVLVVLNSLSFSGAGRSRISCHWPRGEISFTVKWTEGDSAVPF